MKENEPPPQSENITWHRGSVDRASRAALYGHRGATIWLTGLSGSGKSTVSVALEAALLERGAHTAILDGDNIRHGLNRDLGFSPEDRAENIRRIGEVARLFCDAGVIALTAFISPARAERDRVRALHAEGDFIEVFVDCPLEVCEARDPKGLYKKARAGLIPEFTGISAPYEAPESPELVVNTHTQSLDEIVDLLLDGLKARGVLGAPSEG